MRSDELRALARRIADAIPAAVAEEIVLTGSVSRGTADALLDIEMLVVTREELALDRCFALARAAGLERLDTWGPREGPERRVSGRREGVPVELIWWSRERAEARVGALIGGDPSSAADALVHGVALRTAGLLAGWLAARVAPLAVKPDRLAERIDEALTEPDPRRALLVMTELQLDAVALAPSGPYVERARVWLTEAVGILRAAS